MSTPAPSRWAKQVADHVRSCMSARDCTKPGRIHIALLNGLAGLAFDVLIAEGIIYKANGEPFNAAHYWVDVEKLDIWEIAYRLRADDVVFDGDV